MAALHTGAPFQKFCDCNAGGCYKITQIRLTDGLKTQKICHALYDLENPSWFRCLRAVDVFMKYRSLR
jgi:hypothetical protein